MYNSSFTGLGKTRTALSAGTLSTAVADTKTERTDFPASLQSALQTTPSHMKDKSDAQLGLMPIA